MRIKGRSWVWTKRVNILPAGQGGSLPYSGFFFLWFSPLDLALIPHLFPCCAPPQFQDFLPLPRPWGFPSPGPPFARSPPQPALPGSHCHFSEERRREAGKQPVFCPPTSPHARVRHCSPARAPHPPTPALIQTGLLPVCPLPVSPCVPHTFPRTPSLTSSATG